jgi:hypothetical protein
MPKSPSQKREPVAERYYIKGHDLNLKATVSGNFSLTGTADGYEIEISGEVPDAFIKAGQDNMKIWMKTPGIEEGKFLVVRRDGTIPEWPVFVLGARDPWAPAALRAYALAAKESGADTDYVESILEYADDFDRYRGECGAGDPEAGPHRQDDPSVVQVMRDGRGGRVFIAAAWDADQVKREAEKDKAE